MNQQKICFNHDWIFYDGDMEHNEALDGESVTIPHSFDDKEYKSDKLVDRNTNIKWYKKEFTVPPLSKGQRVLIEFEGIENTSKVYVDGYYVGGRIGAYLGFWVDITDALADGETHEIMVKVDNAYDPTYCLPKYIDWVRYGGIYRDTWLYIKEAAYFEYAGIRMRTPNVLQEVASVEIKSEIVNTKNGASYKIVNRLLDKEHTENHLVISGERNAFSLYLLYGNLLWLIHQVAYVGNLFP